MLANIALHGLETVIMAAFPKRHKPAIIRFEDDFVILFEDVSMLQTARNLAEKWLAEMGLTLKPSKTFITHTHYEYEAALVLTFLAAITAAKLLHTAKNSPF